MFYHFVGRNGRSSACRQTLRHMSRTQKTAHLGLLSFQVLANGEQADRRHRLFRVQTFALIIQMEFLFVCTSFY